MNQLRRLPLHKSLAFIFIFVTACTTAQKEDSISTSPLHNPSQGLSANLFVERNGKSYKLKSEIFILNSSTVRLDVTTTLDLPLASVLLTDQKIEYVLYRDKKYYSGKPNSKALDPVFPLSIDAATLISLLREENMKGAQCKSESGVIAQCAGAVGEAQYVIQWDKRVTTGPMAGRATKVTLELPKRQVVLKFYFTNWQKSVSNAERLMVLQVPEGFKSFSVPESNQD